MEAEKKTPWCCHASCSADAQVRIHDTRPETPYDTASTDACLEHAAELGAGEPWAKVEPLPNDKHPPGWEWDAKHREFHIRDTDTRVGFDVEHLDVETWDDCDPENFDITLAPASVLLAVLCDAYGRETVAKWAMTVEIGEGG